MPTLGFYKRFVEPILNGEKTQTIRNIRARQLEPGQRLFFRVKAGIFAHAEISEVRFLEYDGVSGGILLSSKFLNAADLKDFASLDGITVDVLEKFLAGYVRNPDGWNTLNVIRWKNLKPVADFKRIGVCIADARKNANLSQEKLAERMKCSRGYLANVERGNMNPTVGFLDKLARHIGCEIKDFLG